MKRALVLSSGAAWGGFHIGALDYLLDVQGHNFEICAGTGIGAMNAAFVACEEFGALKEFWSNIGWMKLLSVNWNRPLQEGLFTGRPQREFINRHINVDKLQKQDRKLVFSTLNIATGKQQYFTYPGSEVPLTEALMGAVTVPGLTAPLRTANGPLVEGTFVNSFILDYIVTNFEADEYYGIAAHPSGAQQNGIIETYSNWRKIMFRTLQVNLSRDIEKAVKNSRDKLQVNRSYKIFKTEMANKIRNNIAEENDRKKLLDCVEQHYHQSSPNFTQRPEPVLYTILTEKEIESPLWSFRKKYVQALIKRGYQTAKNTLK